MAPGRVTRSSSAHSLASLAASPASPAGPAKRPRGRPSKASLLAQSEVPSASTSIEFTSASEYSTPATSTEPTPAPSVVVADKTAVVPRNEAKNPSASAVPPKAKVARATRSKKFQAIPDSDDDEDEDPLGSPAESAKPRAASLRGTRQGRYSLARPARKIPDSEEDEFDDDLNSSRNEADEALARQLQEEEWRTAEASAASASGSVPRKRGRPAKTPTSKQKRPAKRAKIVNDSTDGEEPLDDITGNGDDDDFTIEDSDDVLSDPPTSPEPDPKGKGKAKAVAAPSRVSSTKSSRGGRPRVRTARSAPITTGSSRIDKDAAALEQELDSSAYESEAVDEDDLSTAASSDEGAAESGSDANGLSQQVAAASRGRRGFTENVGRRAKQRQRNERGRLEKNHPELKTMWTELEAKPKLTPGRAQQPQTISRQLKPFQLEGLAWMKEMEKQEWKGGLLGDEMGLGKTIQAVSLIMSDWPAKQPTLVLVPPVALMQWSTEIASYTDGTLKTFVFHTTNSQTKSMTLKKLKEFDVIMMSYNSLESMYRKQEKGFKRKNGVHTEKSLVHQLHFHRVILDEAHCIKTRTTMTAKACFALKVDFRWCLTGTPLQNRIGEFFSLIRFLNVKPFASYLCKQCPCSSLEWSMNEDSYCKHCGHAGMQHVSVFNQELLNPIQKYGNLGPGADAFRKLRLMTDRIMLRRLKKDHTSSMDLPVKEIRVDRQFFSEVENDFANSIMSNSQRKFETYVAQGVLLNNYANIFGLIMQMRQVANHPDLILKKSAEGGQNVLVCCICDEPAEDAIRSRCKHDFCRACAQGYLNSSDEPDCPQCHIPLSIDLEQPEMEQDETLVKKSSIINRIKMENWTSSSKIELLVRELHKLRSDRASHKSIIFSQFTSMLQLIEWRLRRAGVTTVMLDGSMTPAQRQASIEHFMNTPEVECFLVSLKAGGVALNLTEASRVFIVDPWWNPAAEWQSADRCHRIGQTRPCSITRLCIEDSVESRMVLIQEKKTNMIHSTVNADDKAMESLSPQDMQFLFRGN